MSIFDGYKNKDNRETQRKNMQFQAKLKSRYHHIQLDACIEYQQYLVKKYENPLTLKSQYSKARTLVNKYLLERKVKTKQVNQCREVFKLPVDVIQKINERYNAKVVKKNKMQIIVTVDEVEENINQAIKILESDKSHYINTMIAIAIVTGRRFYEIGCTAKFEHVLDHPQQLLFTGQAKTRKSDTKENFYIPILIEPELILQGLSKVRTTKPELTEFDGTRFNNLMSRQINNKLDEMTLHGIKQPKDTRNLYLAYCIAKIKPLGVSNNAYAASILGHSDDDIETANSYMTHCVTE